MQINECLRAFENIKSKPTYANSLVGLGIVLNAAIQKLYDLPHPYIGQSHF
ncbi:hypothetical protein ABHN05_09820 [Brevibacillus laterosporus]|uniref:hypothetical protein n=1 Tax=Brevibacillus laterosporus TaxID=1465 RepID=UPI0003A87189